MRDPGFDEAEREAVYRAIDARRDVRRGFLEETLPDEVLERLLGAAHRAPSVGLMQPSRFILLRSVEVRQRVKAAFEDANRAARER